MEFLAIAVDKLWKYTVEAVAKQVGYVIFYNNNVNELKMEVAELQRARERVQHKIDAAERNGEVIEGDVLDWLKQVGEMVPKADYLNNDEHHANTACSGRSIPNFLLWHKLSRRSKKMKEEMVKIKTKGNFDSVSYREVPNLRVPSLITHGEKFDSRVLVFNDIMEALQDPNLQLIGLYGLGGVGKTTLMKEVAKKAQQEKLFDVVVLACVTQTPKMEEIQYQIADKLGLEFKEKSISGRADSLNERLIKKEERVLVILDDLWTDPKCDEIGIPSIKQHKGLKILMTSRNRELLSNQMNTQKDFCLQALTKDEAWKLFIDKAQFDAFSVSNELLSVAEKIAEKCSGLPVAIVTIASSLKKKGLPAWNDALRRLQNPSPTDITNTEAYIYKFIEVSYENLDNDLYKSIFLLCGEMLSISSSNDIFKISVGLGLFGNIDNLEKARNSFHTCVNKLKDTCLLQDSYLRDRFIMHDVVKAAAVFLASKHQYLFMRRYEELQEWPEESKLQECRKIILQGGQFGELPEGLDCPNLAFFLLDSGNSDLKVPDNFFKGMCGLKVLTLVGQRFKSLPPSLSLLSNLRTLRVDSLDLDSFVSEDIAKIGELKGLKVLTLELKIPQLPQEVEQLTQLQLLDLRGCKYLKRIPPNVLSSFRKLVELYLPKNIQWCIDDPNNLQCIRDQRKLLPLSRRKFSGNASLAELNDMPLLTTLEICIHDQRMLPKNLALERLQRYNILIGRSNQTMFSDTSRKLELSLSTSIHLWASFKRLLDSVEILSIHSLKGAKNVVPEINVEGMPQLKELSLSSSDEIQTIVESSRLNHVNAFDIFTNLEMLDISRLTNLRRLWDGPLAGKSFSRLKDMSLRYCPKMKSLFSNFTVTEEIVPGNEKVLIFSELRLLSLENLHELVSFCNEDETYSSAQSTQFSTYTGDNSSFTLVALFDDKVIFPSLEEMTISHAYKLNTIWHWQRQLHPNSFKKLRELVIESCSKLIILFPSHVGSKFHCLETLFISNCESLEQLIDLQGSNAGLSGILCFPNLQDIYVERCERLRFLFPASEAKSLCKLQKLKVKRCHMMEDIIMKDDNADTSTDEVLFPNLEEMTITNMDKLNRIWCLPQQLAPISFGKLAKIEIRNCPELVYIFPCDIISETQSFEELIIVDCKSLEQIFDQRGVNARETDDGTNGLPVVGNQQQDEEVLFKRLSFNKMCVKGCDKLKYLFPLSVAKSFKNIKMLEIEKCSMMEEIIIVEDNSHPSFNKEVLFPNLEKMIITDMDKLNRICCWNQQLLNPNSFGRLGEVCIKNCPELVSISPCDMISTTHSFEEFTVIDCKSLEQIFDLRGANAGEIDGDTDGEEFTYKMCVKGCKRLKYLFPLSVTKCFRNIKMLEIKKCSMMEEIIMVEDNMYPSFNKEVFFPNLEELIIANLEKLKWIVKLQLATQVSWSWLPNLKEIHVKGQQSLEYLFPVYVAKNLHKLKKLTIEKCPLMENIITKDDNANPSSDEVLFPNLEEMKITNLDKLKRIWFWQQQLAPNSFGKLAKLEITNCPELVSIFPCDIISGAQSFEKLTIVDCKSLEQIFDQRGVSARETDDETNGLPVAGKQQRAKVVFKLPFHNKMCVKGCDRLKYLFPLSVTKSFRNIFKLEIEKCSMMEEIVMVEDNICPSFNKEVFFPNLRELVIIDMDMLNTISHSLPPTSFGKLREFKTINCPEFNFPIKSTIQSLNVTNCIYLEQIFGGTSTSVLVSYPNLMELHVGGCDWLPFLFSSSLVKGLEKLRKLVIKECSTMKEIIRFEDNIDPPSGKRVLFPNLEELIITDLEKLNRIWCCPNSFGGLGKIYIKNCPELISIFPHYTIWGLEALTIIGCKSLEQIFDLRGINGLPFVVKKLAFKSLHVKECEKLTYLFPQIVAKCFRNIERLEIAKCSMMKEIIIIEDNIDHSFSQEVLFPNLEELIITDMEKLNRIWSWQQRIAPNSFGILKKIEIRNCPELVSSIPCDIISATQGLEGLIVIDCKSLQQIFDPQGVNVVVKQRRAGQAFSCFMLPSIREIHVKECERLKYLFPWFVAKSFGNIEKLEIEKCSTMEEIIMVEDNIDHSFCNKVVFPNLKEMIITDMAKLNTICGSQQQLPPNSFGGLTKINIRNCEGFSKGLPLPLLKLLNNLKELQLESCDSLGVVFDLEGTVEDQTPHVPKSSLKVLILASLPSLKQLWNKDPRGIVDFLSLSKIHVSKCESVEYLFPVSVAKSLTRLEELKIESCAGLKHIVAREEGTDKSINFVIPKLCYLRLWDLPKLKGFCPGRYTTEWSPVWRIEYEANDNGEPNFSELENRMRGVIKIYTWTAL